MKKRIVIICLITFLVLISVCGIIFSIPILNDKIEDPQKYLEAIFMLVFSTITLLLMLCFFLFLLLNNPKSK